MQPDILFALTPQQRDWLTDSHSLTHRLQQHTQQAITFHLLHNHWSVVNPVLRDALQLTPQQKTWLRHIEFRYHKKTWVSAITIIPEDSIVNDDLISTHPIGNTLFQDDTLTRSAFIFTHHNPRHYTRTSIFHYQQKPLLIEETFFPAFFEDIT